MPVFRAGHYIRERMGQLLSHDLTGAELVVVVCEDGFDQSANICAELLESMENATIIVQPEQGLSVARNTGLEAAAGDYVLFMDSDDILLNPGFAELMAALPETEAEVLVGKYVLLQQKGRDIWPPYRFSAAKTAEEARMAIYADLPDSVWNAWRYVCRRDFLLQHGLFFVPGLICEDVEWTPRMLDKAKEITFFDTPIYGYFYNRSGQLSKRPSLKRTLDINQVVAESIRLYQDKPYGKALCYRLIRESLYSISEYCKFSATDQKIIRPYIEACVQYYSVSPGKAARLFAKTCPFVPLYVWSVILLTAKTLRNVLKRFLGANTAQPFNTLGRCL